MRRLFAECLRLKIRNADPAINKATPTTPIAIPAFAPPLRPLFSEIGVDVADVVGTPAVDDAVGAVVALAEPVLEVDDGVCVEEVAEDDEPPLISKNPVLETSGELELYTELRSLNRRTYFASLVRTLSGIVMVQS